MQIVAFYVVKIPIPDLSKRIAQGELAAARVHYQESLELAREIDAKNLIASALEGAGTVVATQGELEWVVIRTSWLKQDSVRTLGWKRETRWIYYDRETFKQVTAQQALEMLRREVLRHPASAAGTGGAA